MIKQTSLQHNSYIPKSQEEKTKRASGKLTRLLSLFEHSALFDPTVNQDGLRLTLTGNCCIRESMRALRRQEECNRLLKERENFTH